MLLMVQGRTPLQLTIIPSIWSLIAGLSAWLLSIPEDASLPLAGVTVCALIIWKNRVAVHTMPTS
jgi:hypothetical protein